MTNSINEVEKNDFMLVIGSNTTENHPIIGAKMKKAVANGAKLVVIDPRKIELTKYADYHLQIQPGSNIALLNAMMNVIIEENLQDTKYIKEHTENYKSLVKLVKDYTPEKVAKLCGVDAEHIRQIARLYATSKKAGIYYCMGITQHSNGTHNVMAVSNLALLCGNIGKEHAGINPLRGQNNVQGACDMGALPEYYTGYQRVNNEKARQKFELAWNTKLPEKEGLTLPEIMDSIIKDEVKFLYVMGENPTISDPNSNHIGHALDKVKFLVVQDIFMTETAQYADVILPASSFAEKEGTFTNTERRVQKIRKAINSVGNTKPDWLIVMELMNKLGEDKKYNNESEIMDEIALVTPQYGGIDYNRLEKSSLQWPCPTKDHLGTKYLHENGPIGGKAKFIPTDYIVSHEEVDKDYPYIMINGRVLYQYHTRTMTGKIDGLNEINGTSFIEIHPNTAKKLKIKDGEKLKVSSRRGDVITFAKITDIIEEDIFFMPFHFAEGAANYLSGSDLDEMCKIPGLKICAINIEKMKK